MYFNENKNQIEKNRKIIDFHETSYKNGNMTKDTLDIQTQDVRNCLEVLLKELEE